jgi:hypothetical protein
MESELLILTVSEHYSDSMLTVHTALTLSPIKFISGTDNARKNCGTVFNTA